VYIKISVIIKFIRLIHHFYPKSVRLVYLIFRSMDTWKYRTGPPVELSSVGHMSHLDIKQLLTHPPRANVASVIVVET
jgi:hypothetical protein